MGSEIPDLDSDWDYPLTEEDLQAIDSVFSSVAASAPPPKRHVLSSCGGDAASVELEPPPKMRRRLPETLFAFQKQQNNKWNGSLSLSACPRGRFRSYGNKSDISSFLGNYNFAPSGLIFSYFKSNVKDFGVRPLGLGSSTTYEFIWNAADLLAKW